MYTDALWDADFKTAPYIHQMREFEAGVEDPGRALFWQMRTGKSKQIIDTASHLYRRRLIDCVIIFAPNGVHQNWVLREVPTHTWDSVPRHALGWQTRLAGLKGGNRMSKADRAAWEDAHAAWWADYDKVLTHDGLTFISFNSESMTRPDVKKAVARLLQKRRCLVVWDESTDFRTPGSARTKMSRAIAVRVPYRRILDGTALTNSPMHAFAQFELLQKGALGFTKAQEFRDYFGRYEMVQAGPRRVNKLVGFQHLDVLQQRMAPFTSVVLRSDCSDLPDVVPEERLIEMSPEQKKLYRELHHSLELMVDDATVSLREQTNRKQKLQQVSSGFIIDGDKVVHRIPGVNPRLEAVAEEVYLAPGKVIIWCMFQWEIDDVVRRLRLDGHDVMEYHGRVSDEEKLRARNEFNTNGAKALVGQYQAGSRGTDFSGASLIINYSHIWNAILRLQAAERGTKMGGDNVRLLDFVASPTDRYILDLVHGNVRTGDLLAGSGMRDFLARTRLE